jgi:hypothetical protein
MFISQPISLDERMSVHSRHDPDEQDQEPQRYRIVNQPAQLKFILLQIISGQDLLGEAVVRDLLPINP